MLNEAELVILSIVTQISESDLQFMRIALDEAAQAARAGEVPIGAVVVYKGEMLASASNRTLRDVDPTAHAEIVALREAARNIGNHRLLDADLYVTIEPCAMCAGAMVQARIARLIYGADDPKAGAIRTLFQVLAHPGLNHRVEVVSGFLADEAVALMRSFFFARR